MKAFNYCNNCGKSGHQYHNCKYPIISIGIITFRNVNANIEYLMIKRKDSLGYVEFMRGKYPVNNKTYIQNIFNEMTSNEKNNILNKNFDELWTELWGDYNSIQYRNEEKISLEKYNILKNNNALEEYIKNSDTSWIDPEWGFTKGRRNYQEKDIGCAFREFEEETGYSKKELTLINNIIPYEEIFTGSNLKSYKHKYFVAYMKEKYENENENDYQTSEVGELKWMSYNECINKIRPYNLEKIEILKKLNKVLNNYTLY